MSEQTGSRDDSPTIEQSDAEKVAIRQAAARLAATPPDPSVETNRLGSYRVTGPLGEGGMGTVCRALDPLLDREVAIKVLKSGLSDTSTARLLREARAAARLAHPNVVSIYHVVEENGRIQIIMELLGRSLADEVKESGALPWRAATLAMRDAAAGIAAAHRAGMVHRDIKPSNLLRAAQGEVKVVDFGLVHSAEPDAMALTIAGSLLGTPSFMAPEQCRGEPADARSDVYALGCTYYHLLTGRLPFDGPSAYVVMRKQETEPLPDPADSVADLPAPVRAIIARAGSKDPQRRYKDASEMLVDLEAVLSGGPVSTTSAAPRRAVFRQAAWAAGVLAAIVLCYIAWWRFSSRPEISATQPPGAGAAAQVQSPKDAVSTLPPPAVSPVPPPTTAPQAAAGAELIKDGSFNDDTDPSDNWNFWFNGGQKVRMFRDTKEFKIGPGSLCLESSDAAAFGAIEQPIDIPPAARGSIHITGFAKTTGKSLRFATVILHQGGGLDAHGSYPADVSFHIDAFHQWKPFMLDVPLPLLDPSRARVRILLAGAATLWIDELHATIVPPTGPPRRPARSVATEPSSRLDATPGDGIQGTGPNFVSNSPIIVRKIEWTEVTCRRRDGSDH